MRSGLALRTLNEQTRSVTFVASTDTVDNYGEIVEQNWRLDRFRANPVILFAHESKELPIGHATRCEVVNGKLETDIRFLSLDANPKAEQVWQCIREGALRAVSVGFFPHDVRKEKRNGKEHYVLSDNELHEVSVTPCPANPDALAKMRSKARSAPPQETGGDAHGETMPEESIDVVLEAAPDEVVGPVLMAVAELAPDPQELAVKIAESSAFSTKLAGLESRLSVVTAERDAAVAGLGAASARAAAVEMQLVSFQLDALIGTKIIPAEKEGLLELATVSRSLFDKQIAAIKARVDMRVLGTAMPESKVEAPPSTTGGAGDAGASLDRIISKSITK